MIQKILFSIGILLLCISSMAQYAPPAGQEGTTAMYKDSTAFVGWAIACDVNRGFVDISQPDSGFVSAGDPLMALGSPDNLIVSLGDGGSALLEFEFPVKNGPGPDFAVFENSFLDNFLELAFIEVSSDGENFFRFPSVSLTQTSEQVSAFGFLDATQLYNLAGKYRVDFGVPFDLEEMTIFPDLNTDNIIAIRIIDVVGSIDPDYASYDSEGHKINDPWPTPFGSGGFDLDAVGVIHSLWQGVNDLKSDVALKVYPNPCKDLITIEFPAGIKNIEISLISPQGELLEKIKDSAYKVTLSMAGLPKGIYVLQYVDGETSGFRKILKK